MWILRKLGEIEIRLSNIDFTNYQIDNRKRFLGTTKRFISSSITFLRLNNAFMKTEMLILKVKRNFQKYTITKKYWAETNNRIEYFFGMCHSVLGEVERLR